MQPVILSELFPSNPCYFQIVSKKKKEIYIIHCLTKTQK